MKKTFLAILLALLLISSAYALNIGDILSGFKSFFSTDTCSGKYAQYDYHACSSYGPNNDDYGCYETTCYYNITAFKGLDCSSDQYCKYYDYQTGCGLSQNECNARCSPENGCVASDEACPLGKYYRCNQACRGDKCWHDCRWHGCCDEQTDCMGGLNSCCYNEGTTFFNGESDNCGGIVHDSWYCDEGKWKEEIFCQYLLINGGVYNSSSNRLAVKKGNTITISSSISDYGIVRWANLVGSQTKCHQSDCKNLGSGFSESFEYSLDTSSLEPGLYVFETNAYDSSECKYMCSSGTEFYKNYNPGYCTEGHDFKQTGKCNNGCIGYILIVTEDVTTTTTTPLVPTIPTTTIKTTTTIKSSTSTSTIPSIPGQTTTTISVPSIPGQ